MKYTISILLALFTIFNSEAQTPLSNNLQINSPKPVDNRTGKFVSGAWIPYASTTEANSAINPFYRYNGMIVTVGTPTSYQEYWYYGGTSDGNLVVKPAGSGGGGSADTTIINASLRKVDSINKRYGPRIFHPADYGAWEDRKYVNHVTVTNNQVVVYEPTFLPTDTGKRIKVLEGVSTANKSYASTIITYVSPTQVIIAGNIPAGIADDKGIIYGHNDLPAWRRMRDSMMVPDKYGRRGGKIIANSSLFDGIVDTGSNALFTIPVLPTTSPDPAALVPVFEIDGQQPLLQGNYGYFTRIPIPQQGTIIESLSDSTGFVFGSAKKDVGYGGLMGNTASLTLRNITVRTKYAGKMGAIDGYNLFGGLTVENVIADIDNCAYGSSIKPTSWGIRFPQVYNGTVSTAREMLIYGYFIGFAPGEHFRGDNLRTGCNVHSGFLDYGGHGAHIGSWIAQGSAHTLTSSGSSNNTIDIDFLDIERNALPGLWFDAVNDINDSNKNITGTITMTIRNIGIGTKRPITTLISGGLELKSLDKQVPFDISSFNGGPNVIRYTELAVNRRLMENGGNIDPYETLAGGSKLRLAMPGQAFYGADINKVPTSLNTYIIGASAADNEPLGSYKQFYSDNFNSINHVFNYVSTTLSDMGGMRGGLIVGDETGRATTAPNGGVGVQSDNGRMVTLAKGGMVLPKLTATEASALTAETGLIVFVTSTNGTFTSVGFWGYDGTAWTKL